MYEPLAFTLIAFTPRKAHTHNLQASDRRVFSEILPLK
ncbi:hypothetical protein Z948_2085 [Sulfitobacter donghicola DSW-25 = KCTC 12864 = JCM 14565]|nr:hypothetical protein Z948_2085 [Sulfitobacter donghicola DSW-25 = KCTC 12864 = JCM 14565]